MTQFLIILQVTGECGFLTVFKWNNYRLRESQTKRPTPLVLLPNKSIPNNKTKAFYQNLTKLIQIARLCGQNCYSIEFFLKKHLQLCISKHSRFSLSRELVTSKFYFTNCSWGVVISVIWTLTCLLSLSPPIHFAYLVPGCLWLVLSTYLLPPFVLLVKWSK